MDNLVYCSNSPNNKYHEYIDKYSKNYYLNHKTDEELQLNSYKHFVKKNKLSLKYTNPPKPHFVENKEILSPFIKEDNIFKDKLKTRIDEPLTLKEKQIYGPFTKDNKNSFKKYHNTSLHGNMCSWNKDNECVFPYTKEHLNNPASYGPLENEMKEIYMNDLMNENNKRQNMKKIIQEDMDGLFKF